MSADIQEVVCCDSRLGLAHRFFWLILKVVLVLFTNYNYLGLLPRNNTGRGVVINFFPYRLCTE